MLKVKLRKYQKEAVNKCITAFKNGHRGFLIGDKMGLGKTIEALAIADAIAKNYGSVLIVAPNSLVEKWRYEIKTKMSLNRDYEFVYASYSDLADSQKRAAFTEYKYDLIIYDEVHYAKNYAAKRTQGSLYSYRKINPPPVSFCSEKLLGLSGTWPPNSIGDCYTWLKATKNPLANGNFENFVSRFAQYCYRTPQGWLKYSGFKNKEEFNKYLSPVFIARDIDDVMSEIPEGIRIIEYLKPTKEVLAEEKNIFEEFTKLGYNKDLLLENPEFLEHALKTFPDFSKISLFRRLQGAVKFTAVVEYILENVLPVTNKVLVFCYHKENADAYYRFFSKDYHCVKIDGETPPENRFKILENIKQQDECILICTLDAVREGFDLIDFQVSIFAEIDWRLWVLEQAEGRTRRIGQQNKVRWIYFAFDVGVDAAIMQALANKHYVLKSIRGAGK